MIENKFRLQYLQTALDDLIGILDYIAQDSIERAHSFVNKIEKRIKSLESHPLLGRIPRLKKLRRHGFRVLVVESYIIFYTIDEHTVYIHRVIHGARHLEDIF